MRLTEHSTAVFATILAGFVAFAGCAAGEVAPQPNDGDSGDAAPDVGPIDPDTSDPEDTSPDDTGPDDVSPDGTSTSCQSSADCSGDSVCVYDAEASPTTSCQSPPGDGAVGDSCSGDSDCRSGLCRDGTCSAPCSEDGDCDGSWVCSDESVDGNNLSVCISGDSGSKECFSDEDCSAQDKCIAQRQQDGIATSCGPPNQGGGTIGTSCEKDEDCYYNLCVDNRCTTPCDADADCPSDSDLTCRDTEVQFENGTGTTSVCAPSITCSDPDGCEDEKVCYIQREQTGEPGACRVPNPGGGELGNICSKDSNCDANLCYDGEFRKVCTHVCQDESDCGKDGFACKTTSVPDGSGGTRDLKICAPTQTGECTSSDDCGTDEICAIKEDSGGLTPKCVPDGSGTPTGSSCQNDSDCKNLVCQDGHCAAPCQDTNDHCASNQVCRSAEVEKNGTTASFEICETLPEQECTTTGKCDDDYRVCSDLQPDSSNNLEAYCKFPNDGKQSLGTSCSANSDCRSGLCLGDLGDPNAETPFVDNCSVACTKNDHCASNQICTTVDSNSGLALCRSTCTTNEDCPSGYACTTNINELDSTPSLDYVCIRKDDHIPFGEPCGPSAPNSNDRCQSDFCLTTANQKTSCTQDTDCPDGFSCSSNGECECNGDSACTNNFGNDFICRNGRCEKHRCSRLCQNDGQCGDPKPTCSDVRIQFSSNNTETVQACTGT